MSTKPRITAIIISVIIIICTVLFLWTEKNKKLQTSAKKVQEIPIYCDNTTPADSDACRHNKIIYNQLLYYTIALDKIGDYIRAEYKDLDSASKEDITILLMLKIIGEGIKKFTEDNMTSQFNRTEALKLYADYLRNCRIVYALNFNIKVINNNNCYAFSSDQPNDFLILCDTIPSNLAHELIRLIIRDDYTILKQIDFKTITVKNKTTGNLWIYSIEKEQYLHDS